MASRPRALVAENESDWLEHLVDVCARAGFDVLEAESEVEVFDQVEEGVFDLIVLDVLLKDNALMSEARGVLRAIASSRSGGTAFVVVVTGFAEGDTDLVSFGHSLYGDRFRFFRKSNFAERRDEFDRVLLLAKTHVTGDDAGERGERGKNQEESRAATQPIGKDVQWYQLHLLLFDATRAVPAVRYAMGVTGVVAAVALSAAPFLNWREALVAAFVMFGPMTLLAVFSRGVSRSRSFAVPALVMTWTIVLLFAASAVLAFSSVFFDYPRSFSSLLREVVGGPQ